MATPPVSPAATSTTFEDFTSWLESRMSGLDVPGAAIGVVHGDQRFTHATGVTKSGTDDAFTTSTRFGIASLTKIFTATALASLAHEGALSLDDPVRNFLPDFSLSDPGSTSAVTVGHLLSHAGGWADVMEPVPGQDSLDWYAGQLADLPQIVPAGEMFSYSNSGFMLAGAVIEQVTGASYETVIRDSVLQTLGLEDTGFPTSADSTVDRATGHQGAGDDITAIPIEQPPRAVNPAAGLLSDVDDMLSFVGAHATIDPGQLDPAALDSMRGPRNTGGSVGPIVVDGIGIGWMLLDIDGETVLMSQGGDSGLISAMIAIPSRQFGMVVLANSDNAMMLVNDTVLRGMSTFTGLTHQQPEPQALTSDAAANAEGRFGLPDWMTFEITPADGALHLSTTAGGEEIPDLSGPLTMTSPTSGFMPSLGGRIWLDLVSDEGGAIQWLRFAGRLIPRIA